MNKLEQIIEELGCEVILLMTNNAKEKFKERFPELYLKHENDICEISEYYTSLETNDDKIMILPKYEDFK